MLGRCSGSPGSTLFACVLLCVRGLGLQLCFATMTASKAETEAVEVETERNDPQARYPLGEESSACLRGHN